MTQINGKNVTANVIEKEISPTDGREFEVSINDNNLPHKDVISQGERKYIYKRKAKILLKCLPHVLVVIYFGFATHHFIKLDDNACYTQESPTLCKMQFCKGYGLLVLLLAFTYIGLIYMLWLKPKIAKGNSGRQMQSLNEWWMHVRVQRSINALAILLLLVCIAALLYFECRSEPRRLISLVAPCVFIIVGYLFSTARKAIKWRTVIKGIVCQLLLGIICIRWTVGRKIFQCMGDKVVTFLGYTDFGTRFVYGDSLINSGVFAFAIIPIIFFFSLFVSILYFLGVMQFVIMKLGWILQFVLGTTVCESVISAANIFLGMSESPLLIKPYINSLTASEIHSIMVSGFATVSGTTLAAYISFGASPAHLITSSIMAAPATLALSKLFLPETEESKTTSKNIVLENSENTSILDAATNGACNAIPVVLGIIANLVAFIAFVAFINGVVNWLGLLVGMGEDFDFEWIFAKLFIPIAWAMGVPADDCDIVAKVVAKKVMINEFVAYEKLGEYARTKQMTAQSIGIATYAICGFGNPSSVGILIGALSALAPNRRNVITSVALRAVFVGSIVCFMSASFAGILLQEEK